MARLSGGEALARQLAREGVRVVFGLPGVQLYGAIAGLRDEPSIRFITARHEQATTYMADGYARGGGGIGAALVVPGPGLLNAAAGLSTAYAASSPVLMIAGQVPRRNIGRDVGDPKPLVEFDGVDDEDLLVLEIDVLETEITMSVTHSPLLSSLLEQICIPLEAAELPGPDGLERLPGHHPVDERTHLLEVLLDVRAQDVE